MAESVRDLIETGRLVISTYDTNFEFYGLMVDGVISESYGYNNDIVDHPIEFGSSVNDHIRTRPKEVTITGVISNDPISYKAMYEDIKDILSKDKAAARNKMARTFFDYISTERVPVTVFSREDTYNDYYVKSFSETKNKGTINGLKFTLTLKEVTFVKTDFDDTKADTLSADVTGRAQKETNKGTKKKKTLKAEKTKPVQDLYNDLTDFLTGFKSGNTSNIFGGN